MIEHNSIIFIFGVFTTFSVTMSNLAKLFLDGSTWNIMNANYLFRQVIDPTGLPFSYPQNGFINIKVAVDHNEHLLFEWAASNNMTKNGSIRFFKQNGSGKLFDLEFWDAYCIEYMGEFDTEDTNGLTSEINISPGIIRIRGTVINKPWKISSIEGDAFKKEVYTHKSTIQEEEQQEPEKKPIISEIYLADEDGKKLNEVEDFDNVFLVIKSQNAIGKKVNINLSDHQDNHGMIRNITIMEDEMIINLKTHTQPLTWTEEESNNTNKAVMA